MNSSSSKTKPRREIVVVTGASTGIGAATARELASRGFHILAGVRRRKDADALQATNIEPIMLDITNEFEITALVKQIANDPDRRPLRALVNNAGIGVNAPVETMPLAEWRALFDINLFGHVAMMQALLPLLIESRGTVVNMSSVGGKVAMATYGPYASSKFALEAVSDALRREVEPLGVKVIVIEPGAVATDMLKRVDVTGQRIISGMTAEQRVRYATPMQAIVSQAKASARGATLPEEAGRVIADAITSKRPRTRYTVGRNTAMLVRLTRLLPDRMLDSLLVRGLKPHLPQAASTM